MLSRLVPVVAAVAVYFVMAVHGTAHKSGTFDELPHVTAGYSYWAYNDYRLQPENGNWPQRLVALPLVLSGSSFPSFDQSAWRKSDMWRLSDQFFFSGANDADGMLHSARMTVALVGALLAMLVFLWSRQLFGTAGAWVSLVLFVFSPTMLAHGALATSDLMGAAFFTAAVWALWTALHRITPWTVAASTVATAGLFLSKHSAPILIPIVVVMLAVRFVVGRPLVISWGRRQIMIRRRLMQTPAILGLALAHVVVVAFLIWGSYGFRYPAMGAHSTAQDDFLVPWSQLKPTITTPLAQWGRDHQVLPEAYLYGLSAVMSYSKARVAFFNGEVSQTGGWRWFFPYAALVKTTLPGLILIALLPMMLIWRWASADTETRTSQRIGNGLYDLTPLLALIAVYWAFALSTALNIGHRHLLPVIPATIVLLGAAGEPIARILRRRDASETSKGGSGRKESPLRFAQGHGGTVAAAALVVALLIWHAVESIRIAPDYLAYFNALDGGPTQAYKHLVDSSLDWGQDLPGLKDWLDQQGLQGPNAAPVFLSYFGSARPKYYNIAARPLPGFLDTRSPAMPEPLTGGTYCISATMLQGEYLGAPGPWSRPYENGYQQAVHDLQIFASTNTDKSARAALLRQTGEAFWFKVFHSYEQLRFARLSARLRRRDPDAQIGYSILIYRLTDADISAALDGPPP